MLPEVHAKAVRQATAGARCAQLCSLCDASENAPDPRDPLKCRCSPRQMQADPNMETESTGYLEHAIKGMTFSARAHHPVRPLPAASLRFTSSITSEPMTVQVNPSRPYLQNRTVPESAESLRMITPYEPGELGCFTYLSRANSERLPHQSATEGPGPTTPPRIQLLVCKGQAAIGD